MEGRKDLRSRIASIFDLPGDVVLDVARIVLVGDMQLAVENHRGLMEYSPERVVIGVPRGQIAIRGEDLRIGSITPEEIILMGRIASLQFAS